MLIYDDFKDAFKHYYLFPFENMRQKAKLT